MPEFYIGNVRGPQGPQGQPGNAGRDGKDGSDGATFTPYINADGVLSWTNNGGLTNPAPVSVRGPQGQPGIAGQNGIDGSDGKTPSVSFRYDSTTGNLYYEVVDAVNGDEVVW